MVDNPQGSRTGWDVIYCDEENHIVPACDLVGHSLSIDCWCQPIRDGCCVVHNSADEREVYERLSWAKYRVNRTLN